MKQLLRKQALLGKVARPLLVMLLSCLPLQAAIALAPTTAEYKLKAALIYKLTKFVEWPVVTDGSKSGSFGICVLGRDDFGSALDALEGRDVKGQRITVRRYSQSEGVDESCQLLFISDSKQPFMQSILEALGKDPILTISDADQFAFRGGMIQFISGEKRIGFKINLERATAAGLKIAAPLLDLATIVDSREQGRDR